MIRAPSKARTSGLEKKTLPKTNCATGAPRSAPRRKSHSARDPAPRAAHRLCHDNLMLELAPRSSPWRNQGRIAERGLRLSVIFALASNNGFITKAGEQLRMEVGSTFRASSRPRRSLVSTSSIDGGFIRNAPSARPLRHRTERAAGLDRVLDIVTRAESRPP